MKISAESNPDSALAGADPKERENGGMYRRIEIINDGKHPSKTGLCGILPIGCSTAFDVWASQLDAPKHLYKNCRFYFTEDGWNLCGRDTVAELQRNSVHYRIIAVKE